MELTELKRIFDDTDYVRRSGTPAEKQAAEYWTLLRMSMTQ